MAVKASAESPEQLLAVRVDSCPPPAIKRIGRLSSLGGLGAVVRAPAVEHRKGWFWVVAVAAIILVAVVTPLTVTVVNLKQQLRAANTKLAARSAATLSAAAAAAAGSHIAGTAECREVLHKEASPVGTPPPPLRPKGSKLIGTNGTDVVLHGINWFGFNNGKTMVDGLDAGNGTWLAADFATIVYRLKLLGFNAVRLPFKFSDLEAPTSDYARPCAPETPLSAQEIANATLPEDIAEDFADKMPKDLDLLLPMNSAAGTCNSYLPNGPTTLPRFLWVVEYLVANGMYVLIDYHPHDQEEMYLNDPETFAKKWRYLWAAFNCLPGFDSNLKGRVFLDLLNEPDEYGMGWSGGKTREHRPLGAYLVAAMDAIDAVSPGDAIFFIQGGGQVPLGTAWGDGFATDANIIQQYSVDDPNPFFTHLIAKPYRKQVVLSPHFYGQTITNSTLADHQIWEAASRSWGNMMVNNGYCVPLGECQRFPVVIGEIGSALKDGKDRQQLTDMAMYLNKKPPTDSAQYPHEPVSGWFWFCWNANSADTGGLVQDDWQTLEIPKLAWMVEHLGLKPWWMKPTLDVPAQQEQEQAQEQEQELPVAHYISKRVPRNTDTPAKAVHLLGGAEQTAAAAEPELAPELALPPILVDLSRPH